MELTELIEAVKAAQDKAALEALVKTELELDLDKRKSLDTLRAEVLKGLGVTEGDEPGAGDGVTGDTSGAAAAAGGSEQQNEAGPDPVVVVGTGDAHEALIQSLRDANVELRQDNELLLSQLQAAQIQIQDLEAARQVGYGLSGGVTGSSLTPPDLDEVEQPEPVKLQAVRLLRNTENGRDFAWTPELAKLPNMKEL